MSDLISAINNLGEMGWFDYLVGIIPIILSIAAIIIAITSSAKQNKVALFDERYDLYIKTERFIYEWDFLLHRIYENENKTNVEIKEVLKSDCMLHILRSSRNRDISDEEKSKLSGSFDDATVMAYLLDRLEKEKDSIQKIEFLLYLKRMSITPLFGELGSLVKNISLFFKDQYEFSAIRNEARAISDGMNSIEIKLQEEFTKKLRIL